jgi:hypothetical protein
VLDDLSAHALALGLVLPYTAGLIGRVAVRPVICISTILVLMAPVMWALAVREDPIYPLMAAMLSCTSFRCSS